MKPRKLVETITFRLSLKQRAMVEQLAEREELGLGEAARMILDEGLRARGLA